MNPTFDGMMSAMGLERVRWYHIDEKLPEPFADVWVYYYGDVRQVWFSLHCREWRFGVAGHMPIESAPMWYPMVIPEPPK